jgi:hypothetical protein
MKDFAGKGGACSVGCLNQVSEGRGCPVSRFDELAPILGAVGMAAAKDEALDIDAMASELDQSTATIRITVEELDRMGLILWLADESELPPLLTPAGSQYLDLKGEVDGEVLHFSRASSTISMRGRPPGDRRSEAPSRDRPAGEPAR